MVRIPCAAITETGLVALGVSISFVVLLLLILRPNGKNAILQPAGGEVIMTTVTFPKGKIRVPELARPKVPQPQKPVAERQFTSRIALSKRVDIDPIATQEELLNARVSARTVEGDPEIFQKVPAVPPAPPVPPVKPAEPSVQEAPIQRQPEFPGGMEAWLNFLSNNLRTPQDLEAGEKRVVLINFLVDAEGNVTRFTVVKSAGTAFDNEVIRVLKRMPKWKPAIQNNHPVAVSFTQPVTFMAVEE